MLKNTLRIAMLFCAIALFDTPAFANLRAPRLIAQHSMHELQGATGDLAVLSERLNIVCHSNCAIEANYEIDARRAVDAKLDFIAPVSEPIEILSSDGTKTSANLSETEIPTGDSSLGNRPDHPLFKAGFEFHFKPGVSVLTIRYTHRPGLHESNYGYHSDGTMTPDFGYELWPLAEWHLAENFHLDISISFDRDEPGLFKRMFSHEKKPFCSLTWPESHGGVTETMEVKSAGPKFDISRNFDRTFPKLLRCDFPQD